MSAQYKNQKLLLQVANSMKNTQTNSTRQLFQQLVKNLPDVNSQDLLPYIKKVESVQSALVKDTNNNQIAPLNISQRLDDLAEIEQLSKRIKSSFKKVVILGVGGSSLGGKTLNAIQNNPEIETIFLESIDSNTIQKNLHQIDLKTSCFVVVSKSGETVETICQTLIIIEKFKAANIQDFNKNFIFITEDKESTASKIAKELGSEVYFHPKDIGGRFSYLSIVGLLPACLVGLDIRKIRLGAKTTLENFLTQNAQESALLKACALQLYLSDKGFSNNVVMPYIDNLKDFTDWYRQLLAESLGKNGFGLTPINSMGTIDQHSQLQLYLDGLEDKFFTFITSENHPFDFAVKDLPNCASKFGGKNLNQILQIEQNTTIEVLDNKNLPIRILEINKIDEETLSALMMHMFLETIIIAGAKAINPFDQPAVELRKTLAKKYLQNN